MDKPTNNAAPALKLEDWYAQQFLPWKEAMRDYTDGMEQRQVRLQRHVGQLQTIVALLMDGKTRQALLAWNTLQLHPTLDALALGDDGESIVMTEAGGGKYTLVLDDVIGELEAMVRERTPEGDR